MAEVAGFPAQWCAANGRWTAVEGLTLPAIDLPWGRPSRATAITRKGRILVPCELAAIVTHGGQMAVGRGLVIDKNSSRLGL